MAKLGKIEGNPLKAPKVMSKWYSIDDFSITVDKCRACGESVNITIDDLKQGRFTLCKCGQGAFEVEIRIVHTVNDKDK